MSELPSPTVAIVTAMAVEAEAVRLVLDDTHAMQHRYREGALPSTDPAQPHRVVALRLPAPGNDDASAACADLFRHYPSIRCVIVCGAAQGVPRPDDPPHDVRLGDLVVASLVMDYGRPQVVDGVTHLRPSGADGRSDVLSAADERTGWDPAVLRQLGTAATAILRRPTAGEPRVHRGPVGSADVLLGDERTRGRLVSGYDVLALETEAAGIAAAAVAHRRTWFVVRGISEYFDQFDPSRGWAPYASLVAAAHVRSLLGRCAPWSLPAPASTSARLPAVLPAVRQRFYERLDDDWRALADYLDIPLAKQRTWRQGHEPIELWHTVAARERLADLPEALHAIGRADLAALLLDAPPPQGSTAREAKKSSSAPLRFPGAAPSVPDHERVLRDRLLAALTGSNLFDPLEHRRLLLNLADGYVAGLPPVAEHPDKARHLTLIVDSCAEHPRRLAALGSALHVMDPQNPALPGLRQVIPSEALPLEHPDSPIGRNRLIDVLCAWPDLQDLANRRLLIDLVADEIPPVAQIPDRAVLRLHVIEIMRACAAHPGGMNALARAVALVGPGALAAGALRKTVRDFAELSRPPTDGVVVRDVLTNALCEAQVTARLRDRRSLVDLVRSAARKLPTIAESPDRWFHSAAIVRSCLAHPDGLFALRDATRESDPTAKALQHLIEAADQRGRPERIVGHLPARDPHFTGREELLDRVADSLEPAGTSMLLTGPAGSGRSHLAVEYAHRYGYRYDLVWCIPCADHDEALASLAALAHRLGRPGEDPTDAPDRVRIALSEGTFAFGRWLLVFDDAPSTDALADLLVTGTGRQLVVSRAPADASGMSAVEIGSFARDESIALLRRRVAGLSEREGDRVARHAEDEPRALAFAAADLAGRVDPDDHPLGRIVALLGDDPTADDYIDERDVVRNATGPSRVLMILSALYRGLPVPMALVKRLPSGAGHQRSSALPADWSIPRVSWKIAAAVLNDISVTERARLQIAVRRALSGPLRAARRYRQEYGDEATAALRDATAVHPEAAAAALGLDPIDPDLPFAQLALHIALESAPTAPGGSVPRSVLTDEARELVRDGDPRAGEAVAAIAETLDDERAGALRREFGFLLRPQECGVSPAHARWISGLWTALAADSGYAFSAHVERPQPVTPVPGAIDPAPAVEITVPAAVAPEEAEDPLDAFVRLLRRVFALAPEDEVIVREHGPQKGFGLTCPAAHHPGVRCHVVWHPAEELGFADFSEQLAEARHSAKLDQFVVVAPHADLSARHAAFLDGGHPFDVQVWSPATGVREFLALEPAVHRGLYGSGPEAPSTQDGWRTRLTPALRLPEAWHYYLTSRPAQCVGVEDGEHFPALLDDHVEPMAADVRGTPLDASLFDTVRRWLDGGRRSLLLLAEFGEGKSFFTYLLNWRLANAFRADPRNGWIPLRLALRDLREAGDGRTLLARRLTDIGSSLAEWWRLCDEHRTLVILDGFDEMSARLDPEAFDENIAVLARCYEFLSRSRVLITSRTHFFDSTTDHERFLDRVGRPDVVRMAAVTRGDRIRHLDRWAERVGAGEKLRRLRGLYDPIGLAAKPLFLQMIKETLPDLPSDHFDELVLYRTYVERSLHRKFLDLVDARGQVTRRALVDNVAEILEDIASDLHVGDQGYVSLKALGDDGTGDLPRLLWRMSEARPYRPEERDTADARARIGIRSLLKPVPTADQDVWPVEFFHRSMREYFVACAILRDLRRDRTHPALMRVPLTPEVVDFLIPLMREDRSGRLPGQLHSMARSAVREVDRGCLGGNAMTLLYGLTRGLPGDDWSGLHLDHANLAGADLDGMRFVGSSLRYANLDNASLRRVDFTKADLTGLRLEETAPVRALVATPDASGVYCAYGDGTVREWPLSARDRTGPRTLLSDVAPDVRQILLDPHGGLVVLAGRTVSVHTGPHDDRRIATTFVPRDGVGTVAAAGPELLVVLDDDSRHSVFRYSPPDREIRDRVFLDNGLPFAAADREAFVAGRGVTFVNLPGGEWTAFGSERASSLAARNARDGSLLAAVGDDQGRVTLWRIRPDGTAPHGPLWRFDAHEGAVTALAFVGDDALVSGGIDRSVLVMPIDGTHGMGKPRRHRLTVRCEQMRIDGVSGDREARLLAALLRQSETSG